MLQALNLAFCELISLLTLHYTGPVIKPVPGTTENFLEIKFDSFSSARQSKRVCLPVVGGWNECCGRVTVTADARGLLHAIADPVVVDE